MTFKRWPPRCPAASCFVLAFVVASGAMGTVAQTPPPLPDELLRIYDSIRDLPIADDMSGEPDPTPTDQTAPSFLLPEQIAVLQELLVSADPREARAIRRALPPLSRAWQAFANGSGDTGLSHLFQTFSTLYSTQGWLTLARQAGGPSAARIQEVQTRLAEVAGRIARDVVGVAERAGVSRLRLTIIRSLFDQADVNVLAGEYQAATAQFGQGFGFAANVITFDIGLFEQNIENTFDNQTVGYGYSITFQGQIYNGGGSGGLARTAADPPQTANSPNKEIMVASVSKPLTAILTMGLLEENGLTPDTSIAPWLPGNWALGQGVDQLTFADFMTHTSGFKQNNPTGNTYQDLQDLIAKDVGSTSFAYSNTNYAMQRVLIAGLMEIDPVDYQEFDAGTLTASAFILRAQQIYGSIGISVDCSPNDATQTIHYKFPDDGSPGYQDPSYAATCGGYGFFISPNELGGVLTSLRYTENLVPAASFQLMKQQYLGFNDPASYSWGNGAFGVYYNHGGDWNHGPGGVDACVMMFPIHVEVSLAINSTGGNYPYQCAALASAFDNAWVAQ
jgi:CubicO group peptidase (beta-lactamase class C family)